MIIIHGGVVSPPDAASYDKIYLLICISKTKLKQQRPWSASSDLGLHCLRMSLKKNNRLTCIWAKTYRNIQNGPCIVALHCTFRRIADYVRIAVQQKYLSIVLKLIKPTHLLHVNKCKATEGYSYVMRNANNLGGLHKISSLACLA